MPKNTTKDKLKQELLKDEMTQVEIARMYGVSQPYISQLRMEVDRDRFFSYLKFMYSIMNSKMSFKERPSEAEKVKIREVRALL